ncbi:MAG: ATP-binding protein [Bacteroidota bacterium]
MNQKFPIGIQSFEKLREGDFLYVDKTKDIYRLATQGNYYFLSRPRRFGKSLLLSTVKALFQGKRPLFSGLWIEDQWNWEQEHPVVHIGFSSIGYKTMGLKAALETALDAAAEEAGIQLLATHHDQKFKELIQRLSERGRVVLLIDEYDKPIIDYLDDFPQAREHQQILKSFYSIIKDSDEYIRFLLITGVSKFSKVSIFSELNNLSDITIDRRFASLTGITQSELEHYFAPYMEESGHILQLGQEDLLANIKEWYNGYSWDGATFVYNPFSVLNFFQKSDFQNFWFSTGTPTFLIQQMTSRDFYQVGESEVGQVAFESFDIENIDLYSLLFQTGYLTIKSREPFGLYVLDYPNREVKDSMLQYLVAGFNHGSYTQTTPIVLHLRKAFLNNELDQVIRIINGLFKSIPSHLFLKDKEAYYHSVVYLVFQYLGQFMEAEVNTSDGRIDAVVETDTHIYVIEFKLDESAEVALAQIKQKGYTEKYHPSDKTILAWGINFSSESKCVEEWKVEES